MDRACAVGGRRVGEGAYASSDGRTLCGASSQAGAGRVGRTLRQRIDRLRSWGVGVGVGAGVGGAWMSEALARRFTAQTSTRAADSP